MTILVRNSNGQQHQLGQALPPLPEEIAEARMDGRCPRCGDPGDFQDDGQCLTCGFSYAGAA